MFLLKNQARYLRGKVQAILGEERVLHHDQLIGTPILHEALSDHFRRMLCVVGSIRLQLKVV